MSTWPPPPDGNDAPNPPGQGPGNGPQVPPGYYGSQLPPPPAPPQKQGLSAGMKITLGIIGGFALLAILCCGGITAFVGYTMHKGPEPQVVAGERMKTHHVEELRTLNLIAPGELPIYFYSDGLIDIKSNLVFLTQNELVMYPPERRIVYSAIEDVQLTSGGMFLEDSELMIETKSGDVYHVWLSQLEGGDRDFINEIRRRMRE